MRAPSTASPKTLALARVMEELLDLDGNMPVIQGLVFLYVAAHSTGDGNGPTGNDIVEALGIDASRTSRNLKVLEEKGLIRRDRYGRAEKVATVTPLGAKFLAGLTNLIS